MDTTINATLSDFYGQVKTAGLLRSDAHAMRWTRATLQTLGQQLPRPAKRALSRALPKELTGYLTDVFWLLHFRNSNMSALDFQDRTARRAGNTDKLFARMPIVAVFGAIRALIDDSVSQQIADALAPELRALWLAAA